MDISSKSCTNIESEMIASLGDKLGFVCGMKVSSSLDFYCYTAQKYRTSPNILSKILKIQIELRNISFQIFHYQGPLLIL